MGITVLHYIVLVAYPGVYSVLNNFADELELDRTPDELMKVYMGDSIFIGFFIIGYMFIKITRQWQSERSDIWSAKNRRFLQVLLVAGIVVYIEQLCEPAFTLRDVRNFADITEYRDMLSRLIAYLSTVVRWPALFAGSMALLCWRKIPGAAALALVVLAAQVGYAMVNGLRGGLVWVFCTLVMSATLLGRWRALTVCIFLGVISVPIFSVLHGEVRWQNESGGGGKTNVELLSGTISAIADAFGSPRRLGQPGFFESWSDRAQGARNSIALYREFDAGNGAGSRPILASLATPIPRSFWARKPVGGSVDDTNLGAAIYLVQRLKYTSGPEDMGPILASAHAYWEGGWTWLCLAGVITGAFVGQVIKWSSRSPYVGNTIIGFCFSACLPIDGFLTVIAPVYCYILMIEKVALPIWIAYVLIEKLPLVKWPSKANSVSALSSIANDHGREDKSEASKRL